MRRKEREIPDKSEIESIIRKCLVCRLGMIDEGLPYIVPLCFGYHKGALFFHSAKKGRKIEILKQNNRVCFEFDINPELKAGKTACGWGMKYSSVIGYGMASFFEDSQEKRKALDIIMRQYGDGDFGYSDKAFGEVLVIKIEIETMTGKKSD